MTNEEILDEIQHLQNVIEEYQDLADEDHLQEIIYDIQDRIDELQQRLT